MSYEYLSSRFKNNETDHTLEAMLGKEKNQGRNEHQTVRSGNYRCSGCNKLIERGEMVEYEGKYYHRQCVDIDFRCERCGGVVIGKVVRTSTSKTYHPKCFTCEHCGHKLAPEGTYTERMGHLLCNDCVVEIESFKRNNPPRNNQPNKNRTNVDRQKQIREREQFLDNQNQGKEICGVCGKVIMKDAIIALDVFFHKECFTCKGCGKQFNETQFQMYDGFPYHPECYSRKYGKFCAGCNKEIEGKFIVALGKDWHHGCFRCTKCGASFGDEGFLEKDGKPYCVDCYPKQPQKKVVTTTKRRGFVIDPRTGQKRYV
ncbi:four and a half lim domains protein [Anaeramoeba ignava]|uniref:Four and a half lim domains protein n=1 Tax=Anaeramoeba ignava TaxID=1746090 RepID=A0A9Q0LMN8_ANAIG|nr:four and a half lim domains protein [Anaeramoeba ignava]|eukprot:Anaeramoba_ignava/a352525_166.p1 GENE.a352525_166~~a352525_166.p1  ORF type:complete len:315 (-),score=60.30 a352525_166:105-1049(-)